MKKTREQIKKLIEENLTNKFRYHLDDMINEKRPFGNSGYASIQKDIIDIIGGNPSWTVSSADELEELMWTWMEECFDDIKHWIENNRNNFRVKLDAFSEDSEVKNE